MPTDVNDTNVDPIQFNSVIFYIATENTKCEKCLLTFLRSLLTQKSGFTKHMPTYN